MSPQSPVLNSAEMKGHIRWFLLSLQGGEKKKKLGGCLTSPIPLSMMIYCASLTYLRKGNTDVQPQTRTQPWYTSMNEWGDTKILKLTLILLNLARV